MLGSDPLRSKLRRRQVPAKGKIIGFIDEVTEGGVRGWAWSSRGHVSVRVVSRGTILAELPATGYRQDLAEAGIGNGACAFEFSGRIDCPDAVRVFVMATETELLRSSETVADYRLCLAPMLAGAWSIDSLSFEHAQLRFQGSAFAPPGISPAQCAIFANGIQCEWQQLPRPELSRGYPHVQDAFGFEARCRAHEEIASDLTFGSKSTGLQFPNARPYHFIVDGLPLPEPEQRRRVHGSKEESSFRLQGFTAYRQLQEVLSRHGCRHEQPRVLDWGCGCGRVARYFHSPGVTGIDIDADNVAWCQRNLPGKFSTVPTVPAAGQMPDGPFDVIFGISVFTHLREPVMLEWLDWLESVLAPEGLALMSILSDTAWSRNPMLSESLFRQWRGAGIVDVSRNTDLKGIVDDAYYINAFHTHEYVSSVWSRHFEVLEILPGHIGGLQDLVVLRKRQRSRR